MKDFDLVAAKRGATVCTRGGTPVRILCFDFKCYNKPIVAALTTRRGTEKIRSYTCKGKYYVYNDDCDIDLMMADDDYLEKLERGEYDTTPKQKYGREDIPGICRTIGAAVDALANMDFSQMNKGRVSESDHIGEATEKVDWSEWRMRYAGRAMEAILIDDPNSKPDYISTKAVQVADALIEELKKEKK